MNKEKFYIITASLAIIASMSLMLFVNKEQAMEEAIQMQDKEQASRADEVIETVKEVRRVLADEEYVRRGEDDVFDGLSEEEKKRILNNEPRLGAGNVNLYSAEIGTIYTDEELFQGTLTLEDVLPLVTGEPTFAYATTTQKWIWNMEMPRITATSTGWLLATSSIPVEFSLKEYKTCLDNIDFTATTTEDGTQYLNSYCEYADCSSESAVTACGLYREYMMRKRGRMIQENEIVQLEEKQDQIELESVEIDIDSGDFDYEEINTPGEISVDL